MQRIEDVHARFGYFKDKKRMANKIKDSRYDLPGEMPDTEDEAMSTDFEIDEGDPIDTTIYRRYRLMQSKAKEDEKYVNEQLDELGTLMRQAANEEPKEEEEDEDGKLARSYWEIKEELLDKQFAKKAFSLEIEKHLAKLQIQRTVSKMSEMDLVINDMGVPDPEFGVETGFEPATQIGDREIERMTDLPNELRKLLNRRDPELQNVYKPIFDEASRQDYIDSNQLKLSLFEAKWKWYKDKKMSQYKLTTEEMLDQRSWADEHDDWIKRRIEFMYDYFDFDTERHKVRDKFVKEMHKKTTLKDIGEKLDEFILSSKAAQADYFHIGRHILEEPSSPSKDKDETDFDWYKNIFKELDPKKPNYLDDESQLDNITSDEKFMIKDMIDEIKFND